MEYDSKMDIRIQCNRAVYALMEAEKLMSRSPEFKDSPEHEKVKDAFLAMADVVKTFF